MQNLENVLKTELDHSSKQVETVMGSHEYYLEIRTKIKDKRSLRARWQITRDPEIKKKLN